MRNRPYSWIFAAVLVLVGISIALTGSVAAQPVGDVDLDANDLDGSGTAADPYEITNATELQAMEDDLDANYELVSDIDASETAQFNDGAGFDPVGPSFNAKFGGSFDGNNHTITGLTIDRPTENRTGVIGVLDDEGTIRNVSIVDANITGDLFTGGIVGTTDGEVVSSSVTGTVTSSSNNAGGLAGSNDGLLRESSAQVTVTGKNQLGGLVGLSSGTIRKSSATGSVSASGNRAGNRVGGLVATNNNNATVENSYATGAVAGDSKVGGLVGLNVGSIQQTFAVGSVSGTSSVGGLAGTNTSSFAETPGIVESSYFDEQTTGQDTSAGSATGLTTVEMQGQAAAENMDGFDFGNTWTTTPEYPALHALSGTDEGSGSDGDDPIQVDVNPSDLSGDGTELNPYKISNVSELQAMEDDLDANYTLSKDINASSTAQFNNGSGFDPVGTAEFGTNNQEFKGTLDGNNQTITGLIINRSDEGYVGLFGSFESGTVTNISLRGVAITGDFETGGLVGETRGNSIIQNVTISGTVNGTYDVGGLVGAAEDNTTMQTVTSSADITDNGGDSSAGGLVGGVGGEATLQDAKASGDVTGDGATGGLAGQNFGTIQNVTATGSVTSVSSSFSSQQGGLVGRNRGTIQNAVASATVNGNDVVGGLVGFNGAYSTGEGIIQNSTATGSVTGEQNVGGLVGENNNRGTITNVKASGSVDGNRTVGGLVGRNSNGTIQNTLTVGSVSGNNNTGGVVGNNTDSSGNMGTVVASYWDKQATGQNNSAGDAIGLSTAEMTGSAARDSMSGLDFDTSWNTQSGGYPILAQQADDKSDQSGSAQVQLSSVTLTPQSVDSDSESTHQLSFEAQNVSADGNEDDFDITFPDKVELVNYSHVEIDEKSSDVNKVENTLEFSVDPTGGGSTQISGELNVTVSATN